MMAEQERISQKQRARSLALGLLAFVGLALLIALPYVTLMVSPENVVAPARYEVRSLSPADSSTPEPSCAQPATSALMRQPA